MLKTMAGRGQIRGKAVSLRHGNFQQDTSANAGEAGEAVASDMPGFGCQDGGFGLRGNKTCQRHAGVR